MIFVKKVGNRILFIIFLNEMKVKEESKLQNKILGNRETLLTNFL